MYKGSTIKFVVSDSFYLLVVTLWVAVLSCPGCTCEAFPVTTLRTSALNLLLDVFVVSDSFYLLVVTL